MKYITVIITLFLFISCSKEKEMLIPDNTSLTKITFGGKGGYTENRMVFKLFSIYLKENGYDVTEVPYIDISAAHSALIEGKIDIYCEYTGTAISLFMNHPPTPDPEVAYKIAKTMDAPNGLVWLDMMPANDHYVVIMREDTAETLAIASISDLAYQINNGAKFIFAAGPECIIERQDCFNGVVDFYKFNVDKEHLITLDTRRLHTALREGHIDVAISAATDGQMLHYPVIELQDDQNFFHAYNLTPIVRKEYLDAHPELAPLVNKLSVMLTKEVMLELSYKIDIEQRDIIEVTRQWLIDNRLIH